VMGDSRGGCFGVQNLSLCVFFRILRIDFMVWQAGKGVAEIILVQGCGSVQSWEVVPCLRVVYFSFTWLQQCCLFILNSFTSSLIPFIGDT